MNKTVIIAGSSRLDGATFETVDRLNQTLNTQVINLLEKNIGFYDYEYRNQDDDFVAVSNEMIAADTIIFATPVYWYSMSAPMKVLFDRFSDLVRTRKEDGRKLKGKNVFVLINGGGPELPEYFLGAFKDTCNYMDMNFAGYHYVHAGADETLKTQTMNEIDSFANQITGAQNLKQAV